MNTLDDDMMHSSQDQERDLSQVVQDTLDRRAGLTQYEVSRRVNQVIQNGAAEVIMDQRRAASLVATWEAEASAPTGAHPDPAAEAEELRSEMDGEYDAGRLEVANAVMLARQSRKVLLEPSTCQLVVDLDHDGRMSTYMDVDVPELFGANPDYDPAAGARLQEMSVNSGVDFTKPVRAAASAPSLGRGGTQVPPPLPRPAQPARGARENGRRNGRPLKPIKEALAEVIAEQRERHGFTRDNDDQQLG